MKSASRPLVESQLLPVRAYDLGPSSLRPARGRALHARPGLLPVRFVALRLRDRASVMSRAVVLDRSATAGPSLLRRLDRVPLGAGLLTRIR